jgi:hypothetical protein
VSDYFLRGHESLQTLQPVEILIIDIIIVMRAPSRSDEELQFITKEMPSAKGRKISVRETLGKAFANDASPCNAKPP